MLTVKKGPGIGMHEAAAERGSGTQLPLPSIISSVLPRQADMFAFQLQAIVPGAPFLSNGSLQNLLRQGADVAVLSG